jgi:hypothetical protein
MRSMTRTARRSPKWALRGNNGSDGHEPGVVNGAAIASAAAMSRRGSICHSAWVETVLMFEVFGLHGSAQARGFGS